MYITIVVPPTKAGKIGGTSPKDWVRHYDVTLGVLQLVPKSQHPSYPFGILWQTMHPGGKGGMSRWK